MLAPSCHAFAGLGSIADGTASRRSDRADQNPRPKYQRQRYESTPHQTCSLRRGDLLARTSKGQASPSTYRLGHKPVRYQIDGAR